MEGETFTPEKQRVEIVICCQSTDALARPILLSHRRKNVRSMNGCKNDFIPLIMPIKTCVEWEIFQISFVSCNTSLFGLGYYPFMECDCNSFKRSLIQHMSGWPWRQTSKQ